MSLPRMEEHYHCAVGVSATVNGVKILLLCCVNCHCYLGSVNLSP